MLKLSCIIRYFIASCCKVNVGPSIHLCSLSLLFSLVKVVDFFFGKFLFSIAMFVIISTERSSICRKNLHPSSFPGSEGRSYCLLPQN